MVDDGTQVIVESVSRLHFGFLDMNGDLGRLYGSIGVALETPRMVLAARKHDRLIVENHRAEKALEYVDRFARHYRIAPAARIVFRETIPDHSGLGSGTQLALAVGVALAKLHGIDAGVREISAITRRGKRSGIGIACFESGGFVIDAGHKIPASGPPQAPKIIFSRHFPENWCFVLVIPAVEKGLSGQIEAEAMNAAVPSRTISQEISRLTMMKLVPSLLDQDIEGFGNALMAIDRRTGMFFEKFQGGIFKEALAAPIIEQMLAAGSYGAGQSSWGPAIYGIVEAADARRVADRMKSFLEQMEIGGQVLISRCNNRGAKVHVHTDRSPF